MNIDTPFYEVQNSTKISTMKMRLDNIKENLNNVLCVTRFNDETFREYQNFTKEERVSSINSPQRVYNVYNTPLPIVESNEFTNKYLFVIEMLNTNNSIQGISIIRNRPYYKKFKVYSEQNYNRHSYKIITRISRTDLLYLDSFLVENLEKLVFTQKNHLKRGQGIQMIQTKYYKKLQNINALWEEIEPVNIEKTLLQSLWSLIVKHKNTLIDIIDVHDTNNTNDTNNTADNNQR